MQITSNAICYYLYRTPRRVYVKTITVAVAASLLPSPTSIFSAMADSYGVSHEHQSGRNLFPYARSLGLRDDERRRVYDQRLARDWFRGRRKRIYGRAARKSSQGLRQARRYAGLRGLPGRPRAGSAPVLPAVAGLQPGFKWIALQRRVPGRPRSAVRRRL